MKGQIYFLLFLFNCLAYSQSNIQVSTLLQLNASGGLTTDASGNLYMSDFGFQLGGPDTTNVYRWNVQDGEVSTIASGFLGASGATFDAEGNFYQSNPFGHSISRVSSDGEVDHRWWTDSLNLPVGLEHDERGLFVCNCSKNTIGLISDGQYQDFATSDLFRCPNGLTADEEGNLYACNFGSGHILKIAPDGTVSPVVELPTLQGGPNPVGNGHVVWKNGWIYAATIGRGEIFRVGLDGSYQKIAGKGLAFTNIDGPKNSATFNKPNGIAASITGDTLYINVSEPTWISNPRGLHPASIRMITGVCSIPGSNCEWVYPQGVSIAYLDDKKETLNNLEIRKLYRDSRNRVWIGTRQKGIFLMQRDKLQKIEAPSVGLESAIAFAEDAEGSLWLGARGLWKLSEDSVIYYSDFLTGNRVNFSVRKDDEKVLVAGVGGFLNVGASIERPVQPNDWVVHDALRNRDGSYLVATRKNGLNLLADGTIENFLPNTNCRKLHDIGNNQVLVGTSTGLLMFDLSTKSYEWVAKEGFALLPEYQDAEGSVWCVAEDNGVFKWSKGKLRQVLKKETKDKVIYTLTQKERKIILGTKQGLLEIE